MLRMLQWTIGISPSGTVEMRERRLQWYSSAHNPVAGNEGQRQSTLAAFHKIGRKM